MPLAPDQPVTTGQPTDLPPPGSPARVPGPAPANQTPPYEPGPMEHIPDNVQPQPVLEPLQPAANQPDPITPPRAMPAAVKKLQPFNKPGRMEEALPAARTTRSGRPLDNK